jgi:hypothetical protein
VLFERRREVFRERLESGKERSWIGKADLPDDVPVPASRRKRQRSARKDADEVSSGIEKVEERF